MSNLQDEFEATGYASWINSDLYPDGRIYTKEYTEWLEKQVLEMRSTSRIAHLEQVIRDLIKSSNLGTTGTKAWMKRAGITKKGVSGKWAQTTEQKQDALGGIIIPEHIKESLDNTCKKIEKESELFQSNEYGLPERVAHKIES